MLPTTSLRLAINGASTSWRSVAAAAKQSASAFAEVSAEHAMKETPANRRTPVSSSKEIKVICNRNFV